MSDSIPQEQAESANEFDKAFAEFAGDTTEAQQPEPEQSETTPEPEQAQPEDIFAGMSDAQRAAVDELQRKAREAEHAARSQVGRVSALQKKLNEIEAAKQAVASPQATPADEERLKQLREDYSELDELIDAKIKRESVALRQEVGQATQPIREMQEKAFLESQFAALEAAHPDWKDVSVSREFRSWLSEQPQSVQQYAASKDAQEASFLLSTYKSMAGGRTNQAAAIKDQRKAQLQQSAGVTSRPAGSPSIGGAPDDFESAFAFYAKKREPR